MFVLPMLMAEDGIPVNEPLVIAKCGSCHTRDEQGNMQRISWERATPEAWQAALGRMMRLNRVVLTPAEARSIIKYLSTDHGLAPDESTLVRRFAERRVEDDGANPNDALRRGCANCHALSSVLSWRRSMEDWKQLAEQHVAEYKTRPSDEIIDFLVKTAPLHTPEWTAWRTRTSASNLTGRWLVVANLMGRGNYYGEMQVDRGTADGEFTTRLTLQSVRDGSTIARTGQSVLYAGYAWRGRSKGAKLPGSDPDDLSNEMREAIWISADQSKAEGRWFWGPYQEFGFDVKMQRAISEVTLIGVDRSSLKTGSQANRLRLIGDNIPAKVTPADLDLGAGVKVRRIVSSTPSEVIAELDVAGDARAGKRDVALRRSVLPGAMAIYDHVDSIKVNPESALALFGSQTRPRRYQQFEAIGYQRDPKGDVELGPVDVTWSIEDFYSVDAHDTSFIGKMNASGLFAPASASKANHDVWAIAKTKNEKDKDGNPLVGKSYLVVSIPELTFGGQRYIRDLGRWVPDGPSPR
jgi:quinohemoprotein amine dehydrogenase